MIVVGDVMLDVHVSGAVTRISPEAPVPVLRRTARTEVLGGAGNVARNLAALGGEVTLLSVVGDDDAGSVLSGLLAAERQIGADLLRCPTRPTTVKTRFLANGQQVLRVDEEDTSPITPAQERALLGTVARAMATASAVILSDYDKGVLTPAVIAETLALARRHGVPVVTDPKRADLSLYAGSTCITPNAGELARATGLPVASDADVARAGRAALDRTGADAIVVTRSEKGLSLVLREGDAVHIPAHTRDVFDVSGAGDTVVACLAAALSGGLGWADAAAIANLAAGIVVGKRGTATCSVAELALELSRHLAEGAPRVLSADQAAALSAEWRRSGFRVGFTNGCFDLVHPGHVSLLRRSRAGCDRLIVGLNSDASVRRLKGATRPLQAEAARADVLAGMAGVDAVVIFDEDTPLALIQAVRPSLLTKGADYTVDEVVGADWVIAQGGEVRLVELVAGESTTALIRRAG